MASTASASPEMASHRSLVAWMSSAGCDALTIAPVCTIISLMSEPPRPMTQPTAACESSSLSDRWLAAAWGVRLRR